MLATVKVLQSKNASTGTMSMSKKLMAINDSFTASLAPPPPPPASCLPNGEVNKSVKNNNITNNKPNPCVAVGPPPLQTQKSLSSKDNPRREENNESNGGTNTTVLSSFSQKQQPPVKPNSLILVPHQKSIHDMSNGGLIRPLDPEVAPSAPRLVSKTLTDPGLGIAKEVQTLTPPHLHSDDCPLSGQRNPPHPQKPLVIAKSKSSSDPLFSENSDDYLESNCRDRDPEANASSVPEQKGED